ncbi:hypothetical protein COCCADRAFT_22677 [Bipolaris zeicola 26-R-13]|uniref:F-box domain-containing protein n=1 Tax=Cochliobolus carbonum (strain 26-R-13) TaxID=930089 RepID=W6YE01_COCC2|nr:uncharacterized protein COCCADRAFT_22677 [Bipolaris zeicola 26-R-13]EUC37702.1 hypothetical protein COCCADRAFT_22677 [Bipolaris zeicola 26-R-13]
MSSLLPTTPPNTLPPLLRLASELHLAIISFLPSLKDATDEDDLALLQLRRTNRYFRDLVPPPTHDDLLSLELVLYEYPVYACKFCLCLRPRAKFAAAMLKGKTGTNGQARYKRFCADCGFDTTVVGRSQRYCRGSRAFVGGVDWVWCKHCNLVKKEEEADSVCPGLFKACYTMLGCKCNVKCGRLLRSRTPPQPEASTQPRWVLPKSNAPRVRWDVSDTDSDEDDRTDVYDYWDPHFELAQQEDDDWRAL